MDTRNGGIFTPAEVAAMKDQQGTLRDAFKERIKHLKRMTIGPTQRQRKRMKVGRNEPCPCGSGVKFKKCCLQKKPTKGD